MTEPFDLDAYLNRIGYTGPLAPTAEVLADLHQAHATTIPFENIDVLLGRPPRLDLDSLQAKLVRDRRGGYCYEQNTLLAAVLERVGFRVRFRVSRRIPRTHMMLRIDLPDGPVIADVGFGGAGFFHPLPLVDGIETTQFAWAYRLVRGATTWMLQTRETDGWADLYEFSEEAQDPVDFEPANYFVSTHPSSAFTRTLAVQRITPEVRYALRNREFVTDRGIGLVDVRTVSDEELLGLLDRTFGLRLPPNTRFPNHPWGAPPPEPQPAVE